MKLLAICYYAPPQLTPQAIQIGRQLYHLDAEVTLLHGRDAQFAPAYDQYPNFFDRIAPLAVQGSGPATLARIKAIVQGMAGAEVIKSDADYLYARFTTRWMRFVDDVEFWFDPVNNVIQVRSASRVGRGDLGVNRQRIEAVRDALATTP